MKKNFSVLIISILTLLFLVKPVLAQDKNTWWELQSIDSVKYSRDLAREKMGDKAFQSVIDSQVKEVADTGATHIAIGTPYDEEFYSFLKEWVDAARKYGLNVWFRGNFSGWEEWFGYKSIDRSEHINLTKNFITSHKDLFENGDIFSSCPECENGGPGDPRHTGDTTAYRQFLIDEYKAARDAARLTGKNITTNFFPMNGDVARLILNKDTTKALGGIVVIDHYVSTPEKLNSDISDIAGSSGGKVVLGEFGAPIPDIHGSMTQEQQADWIFKGLNLLASNENLVGINYWTGFGGSTQLWNSDGSPRKAVSVISEFYKPTTVSGVVKNELGFAVKNAAVSTARKTVLTNTKGKFNLPVLSVDTYLAVSASGYQKRDFKVVSDGNNLTLVIIKENEGFFFRLLKYLTHNLLTNTI